jgi:hypothetical protein
MNSSALKTTGWISGAIRLISWVGKITGITVGVFIFLILLFPRFIPPESYFVLYPSIDTEYAPDYTEEKFDEIQIGMSKDEVINMLGEPFIEDSTKNLDGVDLGFRYPDGTTEIWSYTGDGACWFADLAWLGRWVYFDKNGKVTAKNKSIHYN